MTAKSDDALTSVNDLFGMPALIPDEQQARFKRLYGKLLKEIAPETLIERIEVRNFAVMLMEVARLKQLQAGLIGSASLISIRNLLPDELHHTAADYYLGDDEDMKEAEETLEKLGISQDEIDANAFNVQREGASKLEGMIVYRENACRKLLKRFIKKLSVTKRRANDNSEKATPASVRTAAASSSNVK